METIKQINAVGSGLAAIFSFITAGAYVWATGGSKYGFGLFLFVFLLMAGLSFVLSLLSGAFAAIVAFIIMFHVIAGGTNDTASDSIVGLQTLPQQAEYLKKHSGAISYPEMYHSNEEYVKAVKDKIRDSWADWDAFVGDGRYSPKKFDAQWPRFQRWFLTQDHGNEEVPMPEYLGDSDHIKMKLEHDKEDRAAARRR